MSSIVPQPSLKRRDPNATREDDQLIITPLGAGNEVGRSCVYMSYKGKTVMVCHLTQCNLGFYYYVL